MSTSYTSNYKSPLPTSNATVSNTTTTSGVTALSSSYTGGKTYTPPKSYTTVPSNPNTTTTSTKPGIAGVASPDTKFTANSYTSPRGESTGTTQSYTAPTSSKYTSPYTTKPITSAANTSGTNTHPTASTYSATTANPISNPTTSTSTISASYNPATLTTSSTIAPSKAYGAQTSSPYAGNITNVQRSASRTPTIAFTSSSNKNPEEEAKSVSSQFFSLYDRRGTGSVESSQLRDVLRDIYKFIGQSFMAKSEDLDSFLKVLDINGDGKVTSEDFTALSQKYLFGILPSDSSQEVVKVQPVVRRSGEREKKSALPEEDEPIPPIEEEFSKEIFDATKIFEKYDTDKSGYLEEHEIPTVLKETYLKIGIHKEVNAQEVKTYISAIDANKDGKISREEFIKILVNALQKAKLKPVGTSYRAGGYQRPLYKTELEKAREIFDKFDADKSGFLKIHEIPRALKETHLSLDTRREVIENDVKVFLKTFDRNFDDKISFEEFTRLLQVPKY